MKRIKGALPLIIIMLAAFFWLQQRVDTPPATHDSPQALHTDDHSLRIIAGSELKDLEPYLDTIRQKTGVNLVFQYSGTLDGVDRILAGESFDAAWFSHGKYLSLSDRSKIKQQTPIMLSPVVMGIKANKAKAWGWDHQAITWQDIAQKAASGALKYAMTNPSSSNSGFTALMGVTAAFAGTSDAPKDSDIAKAAPRLKDFFNGQALTSGSSGWLAEQFVKEQDALDGMINYESVLMQLNASGQLHEPLMLLYPTEGIVTADYPLMLLNSDKKAAFDKVVDYLTSEALQKRLMEDTDRRPVNPQVVLDKRFHQGLLVELPFPNNRQVIDDIIFAYLDDIRIPAHAVFVLDTSGSMHGRGISQLKAAMQGLINGNQDSGAAKFARFLDRERITLIDFAGRIKSVQNYVVDKRQTESTQALIDDIQSLSAGGDTAIYHALQNAYRHIEQARREDTSSRYYSVVLMTDGRNTAGMDYADFARYFMQLSPEMRQVKTFTVLFGDADTQDMQQIAELTGGRMFDGRKGNLSAVFKTIRGYQ